jgi:hypothetical protein
MRHRDHLTELDRGLFVTNGGVETSLTFLDCPTFRVFAGFDG